MLPIFVHIPRTAGTSLQHAAEKVLGKRNIVAIYGPDIENPGPAVVKAVKPTTKLVRGHFAYGIHHHLEQRVGYFTIVRHPVDRVVSLYNYIRGSKPHPFHDAVKDMQLLQFVTSGVSLETDNGQVRQLCGLAGELPQTPWARGSFPFGHINKHDLNCACQILAEEFLFAIPMAELNRLPLLLTHYFGWPLLKIGHRNRAKGISRRDMSDTTFQLIATQNAFDMQLYHHVRHVLGGIHG